MSLAELERATQKTNVSTVINRLLERGAVIVSERLNERYRPKKVSYVRLAMGVEDAFAAVKRAEKQERILLALLEMSQMMRCTDAPKEVEREQLLKRAGENARILTAMAK